VSGGIAVNLHGDNRLTGDLDVLVSVSDKNLQKLVSILDELGLISRLPLALVDLARAAARASWGKEKNLKVTFLSSSPLLPSFVSAR